MSKAKIKYQFYYAVFETETDGKITVLLPDFDSKTFGENFDEAVEMGIDSLALLLATSKLIPERSEREKLLRDYKDPPFEIVPVFVDENLVNAYSEDKKTKCNTSLYQSVLNKIDDFLPGSRFLNRSQFLENAALFFIEFEDKYPDLNKSIFSELSVSPEAKYEKLGSKSKRK
ncbi:hypothetical protein [Desulfobacula sp.]|uniref:hypothetical protein n=1 Tax=Desulfobacula sp. TaxID=2593537 RepID=UPI001EBAC30B|nr:type II toxin-antitoxin system HicB family antitoxin [Desulfobacula sp.]